MAAGENRIDTFDPRNPEGVWSPIVDRTEVRDLPQSPPLRKGKLLEAMAQAIYDDNGDISGRIGDSTDISSSFGPCTCQSPEDRDRECIHCRMLLRTHLMTLLEHGEETYAIPEGYKDDWPTITRILTGEARKADPELQKERSEITQRYSEKEKQLSAWYDRKSRELQSRFDERRISVWEQHLDFDLQGLSEEEIERRIDSKREDLSWKVRSKIREEVGEIGDEIRQSRDELEEEYEKRRQELRDEWFSRLEEWGDEAGVDSPIVDYFGTPDRWDTVGGELLGTEFKSGEAQLEGLQRTFGEATAELGFPIIVARLRRREAEVMAPGRVCSVPYGGSEQYGIVVRKTEENSDAVHFGDTTLADYWAEKDVHIDPETPAWEVAIHDPDDPSVYPESLVTPLKVIVSRDEVLEAPAEVFPWDDVEAIRSRIKTTEAIQEQAEQERRTRIEQGDPHPSDVVSMSLEEVREHFGDRPSTRFNRTWAELNDDELTLEIQKLGNISFRGPDALREAFPDYEDPKTGKLLREMSDDELRNFRRRRREYERIDDTFFESYFEMKNVVHAEELRQRLSHRGPHERLDPFTGKRFEEMSDEELERIRIRAAAKMDLADIREVFGGWVDPKSEKRIEDLSDRELRELRKRLRAEFGVYY